MTLYEAYRKALTAKKRLPELESIILQDVSFSYLYAIGIIKGRWEEAEPIIATNAKYAYLYAENVIKGRWEEGEPIIATNDHLVYPYADNILKWNKKHKSFYILAIKILWNYLPDNLKNDPDIMTAYFKAAILK
jgi:hypothetical protein